MPKYVFRLHFSYPVSEHYHPWTGGGGGREGMKPRKTWVCRPCLLPCYSVSLAMKDRHPVCILGNTQSKRVFESNNTLWNVLASLNKWQLSISTIYCKWKKKKTKLHNEACNILRAFLKKSLLGSIRNTHHIPGFWENTWVWFRWNLSNSIRKQIHYNRKHIWKITGTYLFQQRSRTNYVPKHVFPTCLFHGLWQADMQSYNLSLPVKRNLICRANLIFRSSSTSKLDKHVSTNLFSGKAMMSWRLYKISCSNYWSSP